VKYNVTMAAEAHEAPRWSCCDRRSPLGGDASFAGASGGVVGPGGRLMTSIPSSGSSAIIAPRVRPG
jgi:hypothetical protein